MDVTVFSRAMPLPNPAASPPTSACGSSWSG